MSLSVVGQICIDYYYQTQTSHLVLLVAFAIPVGLLVPIAMRSRFTSFLLVNCWGLMNMISAFAWGQSAGFRFHSIAAIFLAILFQIGDTKKTLLYSVYLQCSLMGLIVFTLPLQNERIPASGILANFLFFSGTAFVVWASTLILNAFRKFQVRLVEKNMKIQAIL